MNRNIKTRSFLGDPGAVLGHVSMGPRTAGCEGIGKGRGPDAVDRDILRGRVSSRRLDQNLPQCRCKGIEDSVLLRRG